MALIRNYLIVGSAGALARLTGFVQYVLFAAVVGAGAVAEAYVAAFLLPNIVRRTISEGALNAAYVPILARRQATHGAADAAVFAGRALGAMQLISLAVSLLAMLFMPALIAVLAPGFSSDPGKLADAVLLGRIAVVYFAFAPVMALHAAALSTVQRYAVPSFAVLVLNGALIAVSLIILIMGSWSDRAAGLALAVTTAVAGGAQLLLVRRAARRAGVARRPLWPGRDRDVGRMLLVVLPVMFLTGFSQINILFAAQMSSDVPSAVAWLAYAERLFHLPLSFVSGAIGMVLLPTMAQALRGGAAGESRAAFYRTLEFALLLSLPAAAALHLLADPIVDIVYRRGAFHLADTRGTAEILRWLALGLPGFVLATAILPAFTASESFRFPVLAACAAFAINVAVTQALRPALPVAAAAIGASAAAWAYALLLGAVLAARGSVPPDELARRRIPAVILAAAGTSLAIVLLQGMTGPLLEPERSFLLRAAVLGLLCAAGVGVQAAFAWLFGAVDVAAARAAFRRGA